MESMQMSIRQCLASDVIVSSCLQVKHRMVVSGFQAVTLMETNYEEYLLVPWK
jgi:hypothetical protein